MDQNTFQTCNITATKTTAAATIQTMKFAVILGDLISFLFIPQAYAGLPLIQPTTDHYPRLIRANSARFHNAFVTNNVHKAVSTAPRSLLSNRSAAIPATKSIRNGIATN